MILKVYFKRNSNSGQLFKIRAFFIYKWYLGQAKVQLMTNNFGKWGSSSLKKVTGNFVGQCIIHIHVHFYDARPCSISVDGIARTCRNITSPSNTEYPQSMLERNVVELQAATKHSDCPFVKHIVEILNKIYYDFFVIFKAEFNVLLVLQYTIVTMSSKTSLLPVYYIQIFLYFENMQAASKYVIKRVVKYFNMLN